MATVDQLVDQTKNKLTTIVATDALNKLGSQVNGSSTGISLAYEDTTLNRGSVIACEYELMYVWESTGTALVVQRGALGTTAAAHPNGAIVELRPRWARPVVAEALKDEIQSWPIELFCVDTSLVTFEPDQATADLTGATEVRRILEARRIEPGSNYQYNAGDVLRLLRNQDTDEYPSGYAVQLDGMAYSFATDMNVTYSKDFDVSTFGGSTDVNTTVGVPASANDLLVYGAASRVVDGKETVRNELGRQGQSRFGEEVPPQSWLRTQMMWLQLRDRRLSEEIDRLRTRWGFMA